MEAAAGNCGLMIPQTPQLGRWLISTAGLATVTPDNTWRYLVGDTLYFDASDGSSGWELWALQPGEITSLSSGSGSGGSGSGSGGMTNLTNATSCVASPSLPNGLNIDSSTCTISGTPTVTTSNATYTVTAVINSTTFQTTVWLSSSPFATITSTVEGAHLNLGEAMGPITLNYTSQAGNGTLYNGNGTTWQVADYGGESGSSVPGVYMEILVGDTLYFSANDGSSGRELWAHDASNSSTWQVADIESGTGNSNPGQYMEILVGDTLYFGATDGSSGHELWAHDTSNASTWQVADINSGTGSSNPGYCYPGQDMSILVGDTLYFSATDGSSGYELWAHDTSNASTWRVTDIRSGGPTVTPDNTCRYSSVIRSTSVRRMEATTANCGLMIPQTPQLGGWLISTADLSAVAPDITWRCSSVIRSTSVRMMEAAATNCGLMIPQTPQLGGWLISTAELAAVTPDNPCRYSSVIRSTSVRLMEAAATNCGLMIPQTPQLGRWLISTALATVTPDDDMSILVGDTLYFDASSPSSGYELWAHDTSNSSTWRVTDINSGTGIQHGSNPGQYMSILVGDTLYFSATDGSSGHELWAHDTSNASTWQVADIDSGTGGSSPGSYMSMLVGDTLYFSANDGSSGHELWALDPTKIILNTPPPVSWETDPALPAGMSISNGVISGTPSVYANNQTYTIYANQSNYSTTHQLYFSVDTDNAHTVVENQAIDAIGFHPPFNNGTTTWTASANLPGNLTIDASTGEITGTVNGTFANATITVTATHNGSAIRDLHVQPAESC